MYAGELDIAARYMMDLPLSFALDQNQFSGVGIVIRNGTWDVAGYGIIDNGIVLYSNSGCGAGDAYHCTESGTALFDLRLAMSLGGLWP